MSCHDTAGDLQSLLGETRVLRVKCDHGVWFASAWRKRAWHETDHRELIAEGESKESFEAALADLVRRLE